MFPAFHSAAPRAQQEQNVLYGSIYMSLTGLAFINVHFTSFFTVSISEEHRSLDENGRVGRNREYIIGYRNKYRFLMHNNNLYWYV